MKKMKMCFPREKTFVDGFAEYILDCKAISLSGGGILSCFTRRIKLSFVVSDNIQHHSGSQPKAIDEIVLI